MDTQKGFQLGELRDLVARRWDVVVKVAFVVLLLTIFVAAVLPNKYEADTTLLIEPQSISQTLVPAGAPQEDINNRLQILQMQILSRSRLSRIIDQFHLYPRESKEMTREEVIDVMRDQIQVYPIVPEITTTLNSNKAIEINTFGLSFRYRNPDIAAAVANRLANDFIDEHIKERVQVSGDTSDFIQSELLRVSKKMADVEKRIAEIKTANTGRLPEDQLQNQRMEDQILQEIRDGERDLAEAESDAAFYRQQMLSGASDADRYRVGPTPEQQLDATKAQLSTYLAHGYTEKHPDVIAARAQIADLQKHINEASSGGDVSLSVSQANAKAEEDRANLRVASAKKALDQLRDQLKTVDDNLAAAPKVAAELSSLQMEHDHLAASYQDYSQKNLEADVSASMERRQKGEQFRVLEAAYSNPDPVSPNRVLIIALGLVLGIGLGGAVALFSEAADTSFHGATRLQEAVDLPVLALVPKVMLASDVSMRRRHRVRLAVTAAALTGFVLVASVAGNWWVNGAPGFLQSSSSSGATQPSGGDGTGGAQ